MNEEKSLRPGETATVSGGTVVVKVESVRPPRTRNLGTLILLGLLAASVMMNLLLIVGSAVSAAPLSSARQVHRDGNP
jgi:hypothetical protein